MSITITITCIASFLSTLSLRRATACSKLPAMLIPISIHALLAESDNRYGRPIDVQLVFLSTLSLRRATTEEVSGDTWQRDFYPRSPCGERRVTVLGIQHRVGISIHALLAESDSEPRKALCCISISIHALLAESDRKVPLLGIK